MALQMLKVISTVWAAYNHTQDPQGLELVDINNKVITAMVIRRLNDHTYCALSTFTHLGLWRKL